MNGPDHYREAEKLLKHGLDPNYGDDSWPRRELLAASVHATLALAAATAMNGYSDDGMPPGDYQAWEDVAGWTLDSEGEVGPA